jgi:hypothetical protein
VDHAPGEDGVARAAADTDAAAAEHPAFVVAQDAEEAGRRLQEREELRAIAGREISFGVAVEDGQARRLIGGSVSAEFHWLHFLGGKVLKSQSGEDSPHSTNPKAAT